MINFKLAEIYGDRISLKVKDEELRVAYQHDPLFVPEDKIRLSLSRQLGLPLGIFNAVPIALDANSGAMGHIVSIMLGCRLHLMVLMDDLLLNPEYNRKIVSHELSRLRRIVTNSTASALHVEESWAKRDAEVLRFNFGDMIRERFMRTLSPL